VSHKDNMDLRNTGDGGWFYAEHELFSVFAPLIGPLGVSVYMAMCRLIPLAAVDPERQVKERAVMEAACVSKGTANRKIAEIVALGMVTCSQTSSRRTPTYKLESLRKLSLVGIAELERRLGGPRRTTEDADYATDGAVEDGSEAAKMASPRGDETKASPNIPSAVGWAPAASGENGGPPWTTKRPAVETTLLDLLVVQKTPLVVQKTASVVHPEPFFKEEEFKDLNSPLPLSQAKGGQLPSLTASAEDKTDKSNGKSKSEKPSRDGRGGGEAGSLERAVAWVKRECVLSRPSVGEAIRRAMLLEGGKSDAAPDYDRMATRMAKFYAEFLANQHLMAYKIGPAKFFDDGLWDDQRKWPWDEKAVRDSQRRRF
jgi:hypothetical protein